MAVTFFFARVLRTEEFAWAASPTGSEPLVVNLPENPSETEVFVEGPKPGQPALKFAGQARDESDFGCTISVPGTAP